MSPEAVVEKINGVAKFCNDIKGITIESTVLFFTAEDEERLALATSRLPFEAPITEGTTIIYSRKSKSQEENNPSFIWPERGEKFGIINPKDSKEE